MFLIKFKRIFINSECLGSVILFVKIKIDEMTVTYVVKLKLSQYFE